MKLAVSLTFLLALVGPIAAISARQLSDPQAGFSMTIPDDYQYEPDLIDAPNVYGFWKSDSADSIGTAIFLKYLDVPSLQQQPLLPTSGTPVASVFWHGARLDVLESSAKLKGVPVVSFRVRAHVMNGAVELIVLGSPDRKQALLALQSQILATLEIPTASTALAQPAPPAPWRPMASILDEKEGMTAATQSAVGRWLALGRSTVVLAEGFFRRFGIELTCVICAVGMLIFGRLRRARLRRLPPEYLAISAEKPGAPNVDKTAMAKLAAAAIRADGQIPHHDRLIYLNALDSFTQADLAILERSAGRSPLPVAELAQGVPEPRTEESLGGLISSLRRLETYGLVSITIPKKVKNIKRVRSKQGVEINRWLLKQVAIVPRGQKLAQILEQCREAVLAPGYAMAESSSKS